MAKIGSAAGECWAGKTVLWVSRVYMPTVHLSVVEIDDTDSEVRRDTCDTAVTITDLPRYTLLYHLRVSG